MRTKQVLAIAALLLALAATISVIGAPQKPTDDISVYFSPKGGCTKAVVKEIDAAKSSLAVQAYSFTSTPIAQAIARAQDRGVKVIVVLDDSNNTDKYSGATYLKNHGVSVYIDARHAIAHNKIMVIDQATVITGSFNFTKAAEESNAENLLVIRRPELAARYLENLQKHLEHSTAYRR